MKSTIKKSTYKAIYRLLDTVSPVDYDCGLLCGAVCCTYGESEAAAQAGDGRAGGAKSVPAGRMLRSAPFWIFIIWNVITNAAGLMVVNSAAVIAASFGAPAIVGMVVSLCNGAGRVLMGAVFDGKGRRTALVTDCFSSAPVWP